MPIIQACRICGTTFPVYPSCIKEKVTCSKKCSGENRSRLTKGRKMPWPWKEKIINAYKKKRTKNSLNNSLAVEDNSRLKADGPNNIRQNQNQMCGSTKNSPRT